MKYFGRTARGAFFLFLIFLPTQFGKHFWFAESLVLGRRVDYLSPTIYLTDLLLVLVFVLTQLSPSHPKSRAIARRVWFVTGGIVVISLIIAPFKLPALYFGIKLFEMLLLATVVLRLQPTPAQLLVPLALGINMQVFLSLAQFLAQKSSGGWWFLGERTFTSQTPGIAQVVVGGRSFLRPYGTFPHPNVFGGYLAVLLPLFLGWKIRKELGQNFQPKLLWILRQATLVLSVLGITLSFSRSAWVVGLGILTSFLYINFGRNRKIFVKLAILGSCLLLIEELFIGRLLSVHSFDQDTVFERAKLTQAALRLTQTSPLFGHGLGNFIPLLPTVSQAPYLLQPVHSMFLLVITETGMIGVTLFSWLFYKAMRNMWQKRQTLQLLSLVAIVILGLVDHYFVTLAQGQLLLTFILTLSLASLNSVKYPK